MNTFSLFFKKTVVIKASARLEWGDFRSFMYILEGLRKLTEHSKPH